ncbi:PilW family protein [Massilia terrae]|uniref:PilW family protein n=1 Tax=Massilia terrae TaxID=1811224 RepID=A0ABT2CSX1_9BURK|nr:PilW family protein [Massilia terrae]MCS0657039.1 PilW family protein [Massilia terrae]
MRSPSPMPARRARGFTLPELLVAIAIGLLILVGMTTLFVRNSRAQAEVEKANRQVENGRFGIDLLTTDLRNAGFYGEFDPTGMATPTSVPDPCGNSLAVLAAALPLHVQGYNNDAAAIPICVQDRRAGTDVLVVRHTRPCIAGASDCQEDVSGPLFQASLCNNDSELDNASITEYFRLDTSTTNLNRHKRDCTTVADTRRYETHIYFVANNDNGSDGIPTLKRAELRIASDGTLGFVIVPLAEGIENMQLEYGVDTDGDGKPDLFTPTPDSANGCTDAACAAANWRSVMSVRINLLARNTEATPGYTDTRSYVLGHLADGSNNTIAAANDHFKRHVFQSLVPMPNPIGRKQS